MRPKVPDYSKCSSMQLRRIFSKLKILKTRLRAPHTQQNFESLMLNVVGNESAASLKKHKGIIINKFASSTLQRSSAICYWSDLFLFKMQRLKTWLSLVPSFILFYFNSPAVFNCSLRISYRIFPFKSRFNIIELCFANDIPNSPQYYHRVVNGSFLCSCHL